ncbi:NAD(P)H-hydrate dehydratase [Dyella sp. KULCS107]|uniref:NAD(P)H-hydrate dehydratase n=1 Tax=Dyella sp. KULCS107 TaxID=3422216 RepID=UPI003D6FDFE2
MTETDHRYALYTVEQVRALDRHAIDVLGIPGFELMRRAAAAGLASLRRHWPQARRLAVWCGPGNNGGDGYLLGALAKEAGLQVELIALSGQATGDALQARTAFEFAGGRVHLFDPAAPWPDVDVHVDALYGSGLNRAPEAPVAALIQRINAGGKPVLALDVPSGLDADRGTCPGAAVRAKVTVCFIAAKRGLYTGVASDYVGELELDTLQLPTSLWQAQPADGELLRPTSLPPRPRVAHKGDHGHLLVVGGDHGMGGAIRLCGEAALRAGAGLVSVATRDVHVVALNAGCPELMARGVDGPQAIAPLIERADVLAVGPGLGQGAWGHALWLTALDSDCPLVLDADGLNLLAREPRRFDRAAVLTPHPGEAARLLGVDIATVQADRFASARELAHRHGAVVVLKGAGSLVAHPDGRLAACPWGNPGMAVAGMGDVLTGVIAGLLAQGATAWEAACLGVGLHARAGDAAAEAGERGLLASDLFGPLRRLGNGPRHA